jgi:integrase/recombinase XerD
VTDKKQPQNAPDGDISATKKLEQAIFDFLMWMKSREYRRSSLRMRYQKILADFLVFVEQNNIPWDDIFTLETMKAFRTHHDQAEVSIALRALSRYLFKQNRIPRPIIKPNYQIDLPDIYEEYLVYHEQSRQGSYQIIKNIRRVLAALHVYLEKSDLDLSSLTIEQIDIFQADFNAPLNPTTARTYRSILRGFLRYLYQERRILARDLAPMVVGPRLFAMAKPPKFLRPDEVKRLFAGLTLSSPRDIRAYALVHLAYFLGLRPREICLINLDDVSFKKAELRLKIRKSNNPMTLPLPDGVLKAMAAYLVGVRPHSKHRTLFLSLIAPYRRLGPGAVGGEINKCLRRAGLPASAYWLRHTYGQNLLETGASIYEIKEMMGHDSIDSTRKYLHVHTRLMREVLFDETL